MTFVFICDSHGVIFHPLSAKIELKKNGSLLIVNFFLHLKNVCGLWTVIFFFHCLIGFYCLAHCPYYIHREFFTNNTFKAWWHFRLFWISVSAFLHSLIHISLPINKMAIFKALWARIYIYYATTESHACQ